MSARGNVPVFSIDEFSALVSAALAGNTDRFDPEQALSLPFNAQPTLATPEPQNEICKTPKRSVANDSGTSLVSPSLPSSSTNSNNSGLPPTPPLKPLGHSRSLAIPRSAQAAIDSKRTSKAKGRGPIITLTSTIPAESAISMSTLDTPTRSIGLAMNADSSGGSPVRKPLALLEKIKRQASALVKSSTSTSNPATIRIQHTPLNRLPVPTVSFAPTPPHSITTFSQSESYSFSSNSSTVSVNVSESIALRSKGRKLKHGLSMDTFFRNRNTPFLYDHDDEHPYDNEDEDIDLESNEAATTEASTEEGDYIPYLPLVLQHERSVKDLSITKAHNGKRTTRRMPFSTPPPIVHRSTPSPTPSFSDTASTRSPITPLTPIFLHDQSSTASVSFGDVDEDEQHPNDSESGNISMSSFMDLDEKILINEGYSLPLSRSSSRMSYIPRPGTGMMMVHSSQNFKNTSKSTPKDTSKVYLRHSTSSLHFLQTVKPAPSCPLPTPPPSVFSQPYHSPRKKNQPSHRTSVHPYALASPPVYVAGELEIDTTSESCYSAESYERGRRESPLVAARNCSGAEYDTRSGVADHMENDDEDGGEGHMPQLPPLPSPYSPMKMNLQLDPPPCMSDMFNMPSSPEGFGGMTITPQHRHPTQPRQRKIGVGRQTIDPKALYKASNAKKGQAAGEWTLLLGVEKEDKSTEVTRGVSHGRRKEGRKSTTGKDDDDFEIRKKEEREKERKRVQSLPAKATLISSLESSVRCSKLQSKSKKLTPKPSISPIMTLPFAPDAQVQKPVLRLRAFLDVEDHQHHTDVEFRLNGEDEDSLESPTAACKKERRSGSAHPALGGSGGKGGTSGSDWTLSLPLPMSSSITKSKSSANLRKKVSFSTAGTHGVTGLNVNDARESEMRGRTKSKSKGIARVPVKLLAKDLKDKVVDDPQVLLAGIAASREKDDRLEKEAEKASEGVHNDVNDREGHFRLAFEALSGSSPKSVRTAPSRNLEVPMAIGVEGRHRSSSPLSVMKFEERLASSVALESHKGELEEPAPKDLQVDSESQTKEDDKSDEVVEVNSSACQQALNQSQHELKPACHPFPTLSPPQRRPYPFGPSTSSTSNALTSSVTPPSSLPVSQPHTSASFSSLRSTLSISRQSSSSLCSRAPIGVSRDSVQEVSFSQHSYAPVTTSNNQIPLLGTSRVSHTRTPSVSMSGFVRPGTPTSLRVYGRPRTPSASVALSATGGEVGGESGASISGPRSVASGTTTVKKDTTSNSIAIQRNQDKRTSVLEAQHNMGDTEHKFQPLPSPSSSFSSTVSRVSVISISSSTSSASAASVASSSSTATIIPTTKTSRGHGEHSNSSEIEKGTGQRLSRMDGNNDLGLALGMEFPMPPTFRPSVPAATIVDSATSSDDVVDETASTESSAAVLVKPRSQQPKHPLPRIVSPTPSSDLMSEVDTLELATPILGAEEDIELPPPTPVVTSSVEPNTFGSPRKPVRTTSPTPRVLPHPASILEAVNTMASHWVDDEADAEEIEDEMEYEDAVSMTSISEEDYEDAVSMLSGVFYSARSSFEYCGS